MSLMTYTPTRSDPAEGYEPRRSELHAWAAAWTKEVALAAGGMDTLGHQQVFMMVFELRRRILDGDYGMPVKVPPAQSELSI